MKYIKQFEKIVNGVEFINGHEVVYKLQAKAISGKYEYNVYITKTDPPGNDETNGYSYDGLCLSIDNTPGTWYLATFLHYNPREEYRDNIVIDGGQNWICTNGREIVKELKFWLETQYPMWRDLKKYNL